MSIIHEALKKVQSNRSETKTLKDPAVPSAPVAAAPKPMAAHAQKKPPTVTHLALWCLLIVGVCGFTFYNLYQFIMRTTEMAVAKYPAQTVSVSAPVAAPAPVVQAKPVPVKKGEILLSGIVLMDGKNFALINKEFYEVGETVEGATITKITVDSVEVLQKGKTRTIKVIRPD